MITETNRAEILEDQLFETGNVYTILDGAAIPNLLDKLYSLHPEFVCLYPSELAPDIAAVAPYLVRLDRGSTFSRWVLGNAGVKPWGIFAVSDAELPVLRRHFRRYLVTYAEDGLPMYLRYYDPRVLPALLESYEPAKRREFFGPVASIAVSREAGEGLLLLNRASAADPEDVE